MAEGGRIEPSPRHARDDLRPQEHAAITGHTAQLVHLAQTDNDDRAVSYAFTHPSCTCPDCEWIRSALAILRIVAGA